MKKTVAIVLSLFLASCGTTELPGGDGAAVRSGEKALVRTSNVPLLVSMTLDVPETVQILSIDGRKIDSAILKLDEQIAVDVGRRAVEVACVDRSGYNEDDFTEVLVLDLKPQHEYLINCSFDSRFGPNGTYVGDFHVEERRLR
ncbi:MAG: hypothetical protein HUJ27_02595 [Rhodobacteraceae bacterium]|nr:hypothetical protein [Paracoccaceae bacterium]